VEAERMIDMITELGLPEEKRTQMLLQLGRVVTEAGNLNDEVGKNMEA